MAIQDFWSRGLQSWRRRMYERQFTECGSRFKPNGPLHIRNNGTVIVGDNFITESFPHAPIVFDVGENATLKFGNSVFMNQGVHISCSVGVTIGDHCLFAREVFILDNDWHGVGSRALKKGPIVIESKVWVAARAMILRGVTLGEGCVIAAGAVVTRSIPPYTVAAGVPAKVIQQLEPVPA